LADEQKRTKQALRELAGQMGELAGAQKADGGAVPAVAGAGGERGQSAGVISLNPLKATAL
jgi:hypothetical protein